jgi:hypothetical protein
MRNIINRTPRRIKEEKIGGAQSTHRRKGKCSQNIDMKTKEKEHLESLGVGKRIILKWSLKK